MENVIEKEKDTVFELSQLQEMSKKELQSILKAREVDFHQAAGEEKLMIAVLSSNPAKPVVLEQKTAEELEPVTKAEIEDPSNVIVKLELINPKKTGSLRVRGYTDIVTGQYKELIDRFGKKRVVIIKKNEKLNLSREDDRLFYEHLKGHPIYVLGSDPSVRLVNTEEDAKSDIERIETALKVKEIIKALNGSEVIDFAMLLEIPFNNTTTPNVLKAYLYKKAEEEPNKVIKAYNNPDKELRILVHRGLNKIIGQNKVIRRVKGAYYYEDHLLGNTFDDCVIWLQQNEQVIPGLRKLIA
jgi:hypothetical protein